MSDIRIRRAHGLTPKHARAAAERMSARLRESYDLEFMWEGEVLRFQRSGVDGQLTLGHKEVTIDAELGFLLAMMKPKIERSIHENLDKIFGKEKKARPTKAAAKKKH
jgi:putative polyhydroxyalkanoate system protein